MSLKLRCPACKNVFEAGNATPGAVVKCLGCKAAIRVPHAPSSKPTSPGLLKKPTPPSMKESQPSQTATTPWYWVVPFLLSRVAYEIFQRAGWVSAKTTKGEFKFQFFVVLAIAVAIGFALWGIVELIRKALATPQVTPVSPPPPPPPPFAPPPPPTAPSGDQWWLQLHGQATGPFTTAAVIEAVRHGDFATTTPACPVGGNEWKPIANWHELFMQAPSNQTPAR